MPIDGDIDTEDESGNELVGAGQPWLELDEDYASNSTTESLVLASPGWILTKTMLAIQQRA